MYLVVQSILKVLLCHACGSVLMCLSLNLSPHPIHRWKSIEINENQQIQVRINEHLCKFIELNKNIPIHASSHLIIESKRSAAEAVTYKYEKGVWRWMIDAYLFVIEMGCAFITHPADPGIQDKQSLYDGLLASHNPRGSCLFIT